MRAAWALTVMMARASSLVLPLEKFSVAPMMDYTDRHFRYLMRLAEEVQHGARPYAKGGQRQPANDQQQARPPDVRTAGVRPHCLCGDREAGEGTVCLRKQRVQS